VGNDDPERRVLEGDVLDSDRVDVGQIGREQEAPVQTHEQALSQTQFVDSIQLRIVVVSRRLGHRVIEGNPDETALAKAGDGA
jgi:hypothetical protein